MSELTNQIVVGVAIGAPASAIGLLGYRRAKRVDSVTEQAGLATGRTSEMNLVVAGMNQLVDNLQDDNRSLREDLKYVTERLRLVMLDCAELMTKLRRLQRKYGENGENGENTVPPRNKETPRE